MKTESLAKQLFIVSAAAAAIACTVTETRRLEVPNYADRTGTEMYSVNCGGSSRVAVRRNSMENFYHEDGTLKTLAEFCKDYDPATIIRP